MEDKQRKINLFTEILFKLKLISAQVDVIEVSDVTDYSIAELKEITQKLIETSDIILEKLYQEQ